MPYYTYILKSKIKDRYYIGSCSNLEKRLEHHNLRHSRSTKAYIPWEIIYYETFKSKSETLKREYALKRIKNKETLKKLLTVNFNSGACPVFSGSLVGSAILRSYSCFF